MPTLTSIEIPASQVTLNDILILECDEGKVTNVDRKPVWVYVRIEGMDKPARIKADDVVTVQRMVETDEEKATNKRAVQNKMVERSIANADLAVEATRERMANDPGHYSNIEAYVSAARTAELWKHVQKAAAYLEVDLYAGAEQIIDEETQRLMDVSFTNTSTSVMSNAVDAVRNAATQRFIRAFPKF